MKRIVVKLTGMPFDPTYEIDDDTISIRTGTSARKPSFRAGQDYGHRASPSRPADRGADEASAVHSRLRPDLMMLGRRPAAQHHQCRPQLLLVLRNYSGIKVASWNRLPSGSANTVRRIGAR